jgi:hypothetical protein
MWRYCSSHQESDTGFPEFLMLYIMPRLRKITGGREDKGKKEKKKLNAMASMERIVWANGWMQRGIM